MILIIVAIRIVRIAISISSITIMMYASRCASQETIKHNQKHININT